MKIVQIPRNWWHYLIPKPQTQIIHDPFNERPYSVPSSIEFEEIDIVHFASPNGKEIHAGYGPITNTLIVWHGEGAELERSIDDIYQLLIIPECQKMELLLKRAADEGLQAEIDEIKRLRKVYDFYE